MSKNIFNSVQYPKVGSNTFDLSHDVKMSFNMGGLYPTVVMDVLPGDRIKISTETMLRFAPLISPVMHRVNVTTHYFFVPNRLIWSNWERWITGDLDVEAPYFQVDNPFPFVVQDSFPEGSIADYMGLPTGNANLASVHVSALPFAAYELIWNEYYKDQNLQEAYEFLPLVDGENLTYASFAVQSPKKRAWMHDYFTSSLPFAQKGDAVQLPLIQGDSYVPVQYVPGETPIVRVGPGPVWSPPAAGTDWTIQGTTGTPITGAGSATVIDPNGSLVINSAGLEAEAVDINTLRRAFRLQEWLEKNARGGTRYIENIMAHFGVKSSDARLNRPEFLGGSFQRMVISEVLSTAETVDAPIGQMGGHGISVGSGKEFTYRSEEHGWIIGLINVQPVTAYQQGINRMYSREDRLDYFWPTFAHIGEQAVLNKEIYVDSTGIDDTFGYVPRYAEYRYMNSRVAGEMRTSLKHWHLGRIFETPPALNAAFVESNPDTRIFAVQDGSDHIYAHIFNNIRALRKIPKFGTPSF